jgi:hypothetical protein
MLPGTRTGEAAARISIKKYYAKKISLNACGRNVSAITHPRDICRIHVHLPNDRAPIARHTTQNVFSMSEAHARHPTSALA